MKNSALRKLEALKQDAQPEKPPEPEPDFTGWTRKEINDWQIARMARMTHGDHVAAVRAAAQSPPSQKPPTTREQFDAEDARDAAILAERSAKAAAERAARDPADEAARKAALDARDAADKAVRAAKEAERLAEEAKLRPPPEPKPDMAEPVKAKAAPKRRRERAPEPEPKPKEWWEERAHWSRRSSWDDEDARRGRPLYECIHEYDPLAAFYDEQEDDHDPFE